MRILHTLSSPAWSGPAEGVALLAAAQRSLGHEVKVAIDRKRTRVTSEEASLPYFETLGLLDERDLELSVKSSPTQVWHDVRTLRHFEVDQQLSVGNLEPLPSRRARACQRIDGVLHPVREPLGLCGVEHVREL